MRWNPARMCFPALAQSAETGTVLLADPSGKTTGEARKALMQQIAQRQQEAAEEQRKQQAAGAAPKAAAPAPATCQAGGASRG